MFFDWVKVLHPSWHRIGHCGGILPSQSLGLVLKKLNPTQQTASDARIKWSKLTQETHKMMNLNKHTKTKSKPTCNTWVSYSLSVKTLYHTRCTSPTISALRQTSRLDISAFGLVTVSDCVPYAAVDVRRPSFPGRRLASLEQSATSRHVCTVTACFLQSSEDSSLQSQLSSTTLSCLRSDTRHYGHVNRRSYLLTNKTTVLAV